MTGHNNFMAKAFGLFIDMDKMVGISRRGSLVKENAAEEVARLKGRGRPMFKDVQERTALKLSKTQTLGSGVVILYYQPRTD